MKTVLRACLATAILAGLTGCEIHPAQRSEVPVYAGDYDLRIAFSDRDRAIIRDYYHGASRLPPGLAKQGKIPPGHAFRLQRNHEVPAGVAWQALPADVERRLGRLPEGYVRVRIGADVAILQARTRIVLDVIDDLGD